MTIASSESHRSKVLGAGFGFHAVRPDRTVVTADREASRRSTELRTGSQFAVKNLLRYAERTYEDLLEACRGADLFVSHPGAFCGPLVAEKLNLRWVSVALAPATLFSASDPPVLPSMAWLAKLPRIGSLPHSLIFRAFKKFTRGWMKPLDDLRKRTGLPPATKHPFFEGMFSPFGTLGWFSRLLASPQRDWPPHTEITGFPFYDHRAAGEELEPELASFLDDGEPPVVFTLGSNVVREAGDFYHESFEAARRTGRRAVLLTGDDPRNRPRGELPKSIFPTAYAPYSQVFPRAAAIVHQGGIGTTGQAMAAGVPMLIVPYVHDQPDNAHRAARLGLARVESREKYSAERAVFHLQALLTQPEYAMRAKWAQGRMATEDGTGRACAAIELLLDSGGSTTPLATSIGTHG